MLDAGITRRWHNAGIDILTSALMGSGLLLAAGAVKSSRSWAPTLIVSGLVVALLGLTVSVHVHGWVTAVDAPITAWIDQWTQRFPRIHRAGAAVAYIGNPRAIAIAGVVSGAVLSIRFRSVIPGVVVVTTTGAAVLAKNVMAALIERPVSQAEMAVSPMLGDEPHPFPSGHVAGTATLLGIVAVGIAVRGGRTLRNILAALAIAGTAAVAVSRLVIHAHWASDVVGGALLAAIMVTIGAVALDGAARARTRAQRGGPAREHRENQARRRLRT
ncbi:phosphatase PAP2 family protein [Mycolicibacterium rhodesiae]|uniref:Phosphatidic acid phosphatase type 2/haloperoxidase domain-containing protein n=1 Tax=Mycolicibacterium rhodesiae TaxID=36814 RepID=A0A1X0IMZ0_MYCRH|nr:phosphatase PAP2 family protein [Mycolicibacterium rhodesiae]MCV7347386.1 phosphatase PAP2 family protein [Mycolicibacterium rhodesiae]ORB49683.1 hypothetical protein BST42_22390 [Mycolicibacterium rhodesiae]